MNKVKGSTVFVWSIYGIQAFIVLPWFLGAIYRGEQSLWVSEEYSHTAALHGPGDAAFMVYLYLVFYSSLALVPYFLLGFRYPPDALRAAGYFREGRFLLGGWFAGSFLLFERPLFAFFREMPSEVWNGWLLIFWIASAVGVVCLVLTLEKRVKTA